MADFQGFKAMMLKRNIELQIEAMEALNNINGSCLQLFKNLTFQKELEKEASAKPTGSIYEPDKTISDLYTESDQVSKAPEFSHEIGINEFSLDCSSTESSNEVESDKKNYLSVEHFYNCNSDVASRELLRKCHDENQQQQQQEDGEGVKSAICSKAKEKEKSRKDINQKDPTLTVKNAKNHNLLKIDDERNHLSENHESLLEYTPGSQSEFNFKSGKNISIKGNLKKKTFRG